MQKVAAECGNAPGFETLKALAEDLLVLSKNDSRSIRAEGELAELESEANRILGEIEKLVVR